MRRARVIATIGPACDDEDSLVSMMESGMDIARLNYSHGDHAGKDVTNERLRKAEQRVGRPLGVLADLPGPKIRIGSFPGSITLQRGEKISLCCGVNSGLENGLPVPWPGLSADLKAGEPVLLADGLIRLEVIESSGRPGEEVICEVIDGGELTERKGVNVPSTVVNLPAVGEKDRSALEHALSINVDFVAVSYVRNAEDLKPAKEMIEAAGVHTWLVAKIEHPSALENLDSIIDAADVVMVARGDLGVEIPLEQVPAAQERIVAACLEKGKPVVVATQMLESMLTNPRPTRAEVSDVATAIRQGASAVMLSGETSVGEHALVAVSTMSNIAETVAEAVRDLPPPPAFATYQSTRAVAAAAVQLAEEVKADRLLVATEHGSAARLMAGHRPQIPITAITNRTRAMRRMCILPGVDSVLVIEAERARESVSDAASQLFNDDRVQSGDRIVAVSGSPQAISGRTSTIRLLQITKDGGLSDLE